MNTDLPRSLTRFGDELEQAIRRELAESAPIVQPRSTRVRVAVRSGLALTVAALAVLAVLAVLAGLATRAGESAWANQVLKRAAAVLAPEQSARTILQVAATETLSPLPQKGSDTTTSSVSEEGWLQQGPPWNERAIVHPAGGPVLEENSTGQIYNMTDDELYPGTQLPAGKPRYALLPGAHPGSFRLRVQKMPHGFSTTTITSAEATAIRNGSQTVSWAVTWNGRVQKVQALAVPSLRQMRRLQPEQPDATSLAFAAQLHGLLSTGHARVSRATTADGRRAIEIAYLHPESGPRTIYYVNPATYAPIELDIYGYETGDKDVTRTRFTTYRTLPLAGHRRLLHFTVPSTARVDRAPADYWRASEVPRPF